MKKYYFNLFIALMAVVGFTACSSDDDDYQWASVSGNQVYFSNTLPSSYNISKATNTITVPLSRVKTDEAITVNLAHTDATGFFNVPSSVNFAAGQSKADITITYDPENVAYDENHKDTLKIDSGEYTTIYGASSYAFSAMMPSPYESLGKGVYKDTFFGYTTTVEIRQNTESPNVFRIYGCFDPVNDQNAEDYLQITILQPGMVVAGQTVEQEGLVYYDDTNSGYHHPTYDADVLVCHPYGFSSTKDISMWGYNCVKEYQADGIPGEIQLAPFYYMDGVGGWNYSQKDGVIDIVFPGFEKKDYTLELEYLGRLTDNDEQDFAQMAINMGADLESVKYAVTELGGDPNELYEGIIDGSVEAPEVTSSCCINWPLDESGTYYLVAVGYADGEEKVAIAETIRFKSSHEFAPTFTPVGTGTYTYAQYWKSDDEGLVISMSSVDNTYRIANWGGGTNFTFTWDPETNKCQVVEQFTGYTDDSYGDVFVSDLPSYDEESTYEDYPCFYDPSTQTFTFNLIYYVSAGYFDFGPETFKVEWSSTSTAPAAKVKNMYFLESATPKKIVKTKSWANFSSERKPI